MTTIITRNRATGLLSINDSPAVLRGCAYDLFYDPKRSTEILAYAGTENPVKPTYAQGSDPCQTEFPQAQYVAWAEGANEFGDFFQTIASLRCNFVRVFLSGGGVIRNNALVSLTPFNTTLVGGKIKFDVRGAALDGNWNAAYFDRLTAFVAAADAAGVVVQLSLFNYYDISDDAAGGALQQWSISPWNSGNCLNGGTWAEQHLIPSNLTSPQPIDKDTTKEPERQRFFIQPPNELRAVQQELIGRVIQSIGTHRNVVLELMNEPHGTQDLATVAEFDSYMTKLVILYRRNLGVQALISVNATPLGGKTDLEVWKANGLPNLAEPDIVSYHGLTMLPNNNQFRACGGEANVSVERVDSEAIASRASEHARVTPDKALLYSTDAVKSTPFIHRYNNRALDMQLRDGQITCSPRDESLKEQLLHTYVYHWARKCLAQNAGAAKGRYHFHNHSTYRLGAKAVGDAATQLGL